jgi:hypothetical protein
MSHRLTNGVNFTHAAMKAIMDDVAVNSKLTRPLRNSLGHAKPLLIQTTFNLPEGKAP